MASKFHRSISGATLSFGFRSQANAIKKTLNISQSKLWKKLIYVRHMTKAIAHILQVSLTVES